MGRKQQTGSERNERVLHTRIPASLDSEIKRVADRMRIPVSNLVRNMLEDALGFVEKGARSVEQSVESLRDKASVRLAEYAETIRSGMLGGEESSGQVKKDMAEGNGPLADVLKQAFSLPLAASNDVGASEKADVAVEVPPLRKGKAANRAEIVLAWQPVELAAKSSCVLCGKSLPAGSDARLGLTEDPMTRLFACVRCEKPKSAKRNGKSGEAKGAAKAEKSS